MSWWVWLALASLLGMGCAFFAALSLSAGTAYGTEYHSLTRRQRVMARVLYLGALALAIICGIGGLALAAWAIRVLLA